MPTEPVIEKRNLTPEETLEIQEMQRLVSARRFEAVNIKGNTALVPRGQEIAAELEAIANLLENAKNHYISQKLLECGYKPETRCSLNLTTGEVMPEENRSMRRAKK